MSKQLLEVQPRDLKFILELKKRSSCSVRLVNKSNCHVAFKVKTTSPTKYCVRPNRGIISPKSTRDFTVTMKAQKEYPPDMICKDRFLIQGTLVPAKTSVEEITRSMYFKHWCEQSACSTPVYTSLASIVPRDFLFVSPLL